MLKAKGAIVKATEQPIDTGTATGKCFLDMLGVFAEFETNLRRTTDQDLSIQEAALRAAGCDVIRAEKQSGTSTINTRDQQHITLADEVEHRAQFGAPLRTQPSRIGESEMLSQ
jgi:DNA invertase Pin-like site-specific DNA recombinase